MNAETKDERLRRLLREADPAADDPGLSLEEVREMRRTVLSAVPERRRGLLVPVLTGAAVAILALALGLALWPGPQAPAVRPQETGWVATVPRTAPVPVPVAPIEPEAPAARATAPERPPAAAPETSRRRPARRRPSSHRAPVSAPEAATVVASSPAPREPETHQIQFSTPGGTRIIWVLTSDKASG